MANITIDGKPYSVPDGSLLIDAIDQAKTKLPRYCYHPGLSVAGNCRICQVEVEKMPRTVIACNTRVTEGMVVHTASAKAKESQQIVLEFLLANHPLDCPVCDQAGECKLQDYYMEYGLYDPKFDDQKVKKAKKAVAVGPTIMLDQERCILCSRCVRFTDEITKTHEFGIFNRGDVSELDVYPGMELKNNYSGNVADICPVGALTDRDFRFKMRVWYLGSQESVCPGCSRGCNININYERSRPYKSDKGRVMRLKPRENAAVNRWWMCDEGRYAYKAIDQDRMTTIRTTAGATTWEAAVREVARLLKAAPAAKWGVIASAQHTNEELYLVRKVFKDLLKWPHLGYHEAGEDGPQDEILLRKDKNPNTAGASVILDLGAANGAASVLERARKGELEGLVVFGRDLSKMGAPGLLQEVRSKVRTIVYIGSAQHATAAAADVALPEACYAEKDGTFTNFEGRVQRIRMAVPPAGDARPGWKILSEIAAEIGEPLVFSKAEEVFKRLAAEQPAFAGMDYKVIGSQGAVWSRR
ncbi:MAG: Nitrate reductase [Candidatus Omnitrophica bacterium]|nr:Nitrate reductase [Candidatus Omnitrophota bacterium]